MGDEAPIELRRLGRSGLNVPVVGMGTWKTFDVRGKAAESARRGLVERALETGLKMFDSSPMYGQSERVLAQALGSRREEAIVATKVWAPGLQEGRRQIDSALRLYGTVDLYQIHNLVSWQTHLAVLEQLREQGDVTAIGATHYSSGAFAELEEVMKTGRITAIQIPYNPRQRQVEQRILPLAAELDLGVVIMRPFGEGSLMRSAPRPGQLSPLGDYGVTNWAQALLKWVLSDLRCHVAIPATTSTDHLSENAAAARPPWFGLEERQLVAGLASA